MKIDFKNPKYLFFIPLFFTIVYFLFIFNNNFSINGGTFEMFFTDALFLIVKNALIQIVFYFALYKFVANKNFLMLLTILVLFFIPGSIIYKIIVIILTIISIIYKKPNNNVLAIFEIICIIISFMAIFLLGYNTVVAIYHGISYASRNSHYKENYNVKVNDNTKNPNIYWVHMDGMASLDFINKYYKRDLSDYRNNLEDKDFYVNSDTSFNGGYHTILALNALFNPMYYDNFLKDYLAEYEKCVKNKCITKNSVDFKDTTEIRFNNELFQGLKKKNYTTISIALFDQYTSMDADYIYDLNGQKIGYFKNNNSQDDLYNYVLKVRGQRFNHLVDNYLAEKKIKPVFSNKDYPLLSSTDSLQIKSIMKSLEDSYSIEDNPKFYFIDNIILHLNWNFDENGKLIREFNDDLDDYDKTYIYALKLMVEMISYIQNKDNNAIIIIQGDHGIHAVDDKTMKSYYNVDSNELLNIRNSTFSAIYIPEEYKNGDEIYLNNPLNISRYIINNYVGNNYDYIK